MRKQTFGIWISLLLIASMFIGMTSAVAEDSWPMLGHDAGHTGFSTTSAPDTNELLFMQENIIGGTYNGGVTAEDGKVYIISFFGSNGHLYCINAYTGSILYHKEGFGSSHSAPVIYEGHLYFGTYDNNIYCVEAATGDEVWSYDTGDYVSASPVVVDDKLYIGGYNGKMYCFNINNPTTPLWETPGLGVMYDAAAVVDGKVYVGTESNKVFCLNANNGAIIWGYSTMGKIKNAPSVVDNRVYISSYGNTLYCLDAIGNGDGTTSAHWTYPIDVDGISTTVVHEDKVYIGSEDRKFYCINALSGVMEWQYPTTLGKFQMCKPAFADGKIYFGDHLKNFYCLDADDGAEIWTYRLADPTKSGIAAYNGIIYTITIGGKLYAFGEPDIVADTPEQPDGPIEGQVGEVLEFTTSSPSYDHEVDVMYFFDWGDGNNTYWIPEDGVSSEEEYGQSHAYSEPGEYEIRVRARLIGHASSSPWSEPTTVHINRLSIGGISGGLGISTSITNHGYVSKDVHWNISLVGGTFPGFHLNKNYNGIEWVEAGETVSIGAPTVFGLGKFKLTISAECAGEEILEKEIDARILFFYVILS